jgi:hypothetical protein
MPSAANHLEHRQQHINGNGELQTRWHPNANTPQTGQHLTYAAATATHIPQAITPYRPTNFYTVDKGNTYPYPFEDIPHLLITGRHSSATLPKNEIVFRHIFERGQTATREVLHACRTYAMQAIRNRLGMSLTNDAVGDPITVVTKKTNKSEWFLT